MVAQWLSKRGSSVVSELASGARGPRFDPRAGKFRKCPNGRTLDKCAVLRIGTLNGCPLSREGHPLYRLKNPTVIGGFHPVTRTVKN